MYRRIATYRIQTYSGRMTGPVQFQLELVTDEDRSQDSIRGVAVTMRFRDQPLVSARTRVTTSRVALFTPLPPCLTTLASSAPTPPLQPPQHLFVAVPVPTNGRLFRESPQRDHNKQRAIAPGAHRTPKPVLQTHAPWQQPLPLHRKPPTLQQFQFALVVRLSYLPILAHIHDNANDGYLLPRAQSITTTPSN